MFELLQLWFGALLRIFHTPRSLMLENLALRQQLAVLKRRHPKPRLGPCDKLFWVVARRFWSKWKDALLLVSPETVVGWHRAGFRLYWAMLCKVRRQVGGKRISKEIRDLIFQMVVENPTGVPMGTECADSAAASTKGASFPGRLHQRVLFRPEANCKSSRFEGVGYSHYVITAASRQLANHGGQNAEELQARSAQGTGRDSTTNKPDVPAHRAQIGWLASSGTIRTRPDTHRTGSSGGLAAPQGRPLVL